ncbi:hypothetical protein FRX31_005546 [Thalictrum thalictroides]|uniref:Uncharacterized protein n=1 Tax=Thalictrum thalictroides TaxID=46969 RepID=A0A7J6X7N3_THATH|nr:hypothetical protein FRX31_005546 [Thalictrum thalictroides]
MATWEIWKSRCVNVFQNVYVDPAKTASFIDYSVDRIQNIASTYSNLQHARIHPTIWIPPGKGSTKINVDISYKSADSPIGIGFIFRDYKGSFILAGIVAGNVGSSEEAECWGILAAIRQGIQQHLEHAY